MAGLGVAIAAARREQIAKQNTFIDHEPDDVIPNVKLELDGTFEKMLDNTDNEIHTFLLKLLGKNTLNSADIASLINISTYYENLGDNLKDLGKAIIKGNEKKTLFSETQKEDILKMIHNNKEFIDYLSELILQYYSLNKEKTYDEAMQKYHEIKGFYYEARERHYDNVDKSLIPALNAHLYGDVLVYFNRSISNLVNIVEALTGKDK